MLPIIIKEFRSYEPETNGTDRQTKWFLYTCPWIWSWWYNSSNKRAL